MEVYLNLRRSLGFQTTPEACNLRASVENIYWI
jgi:hypothetical protein